MQLFLYVKNYLNFGPEKFTGSFQEINYSKEY